MERTTIRSRLTHAWNAFRNPDQTSAGSRVYGDASYSKPDRVRLRSGNERSIVNAIYNRMAIDVSSIPIMHVRTNENFMFEDIIDSGLNYCLNTEANADQPSRAFFMDVAMSLFDEGCIAIVPVDTTLDPRNSGSYDIQQLRTGKITEWFPSHVRINLYNELTGTRSTVTLPKKMVAIIENPFYAIMNEPNSVLQRLIRKLNLLDVIDEQSGSGKLDLILQLPYTIKTEARRDQAEIRRKDLEKQLAGSKYGIAYTDGTERVTQLNRPAENNLMSQIQYLTSMLYSQLGITEEILNGTASEDAMTNYMERTIEPILSAILDEMKRKFLTKTARTQRQTIMYFRDAFKLVPANELANMADKFTRNEVMSTNEIRAKLGLKPSDDERADELRNKNLNAPTAEAEGLKEEQQKADVEMTKAEIAKLKAETSTMKTGQSKEEQKINQGGE